MDLNSGVTVARAMIHGGELDAAQDLGSDWGWVEEGGNNV